jgi:hypothetical protein
MYNPQKDYGNYYENSEIDVYLNAEFKQLLDSAINNKIITSNIKIIDKASIMTMNNDTINIEREIFLLSITELREYSGPAGIEGEPLIYFFFSRTGASIESGEKFPSWLRSATTMGEDRVFIYSYNGSIALMEAWGELHMRPVFCVGNKEIIRKQTGIHPLRSGYVLD